MDVYYNKKQPTEQVQQGPGQVLAQKISCKEQVQSVSFLLGGSKRV